MDGDPGATERFLQAWHQAKVGYAALPDWRHFLWLLALDKAAQWEIRGVG